jgi:hypothetical protein
MDPADFMKMASSGGAMPEPPNFESDEEEFEEEEEEESNSNENSYLTLNKKVDKADSNVLFGKAYEDKFIEYLEGDEIDDGLDLSEKMLEDSLGLPLEKI